MIEEDIGNITVINEYPLKVKEGEDIEGQLEIQVLGMDYLPKAGV